MVNVETAEEDNGKKKLIAMFETSFKNNIIM